MIEDHVVSLELSKKLKELGVKQESEFSWVVGESKLPFLDDTDTAKMIIELDKDNQEVRPKLYSAFLSSELGEMLPKGCTTYKPFNSTKDYLCWYRVGGQLKYKPHQGEDLRFEANTEANAKAKCLIYLIENGLLEAKHEGRGK